MSTKLQEANSKIAALENRVVQLEKDNVAK